MAFLPCYSYSDPYTYGNATVNGLQWSMGTVVPTAPGLEINGVIYRYTTTKDPDDPFKVHVYNEDTEGGYIFRETDDWTGLPGNTINKLLAFDNIPISRWGDGAIEGEGQGEISDPTVVYTYRIDECFDPQLNPSCPGYIDPTSYVVETPELDIYDALSDDAVKNALKETDADVYEDEDDESIEAEEEKATEDDFEKGLAAAQNALTLANNISQEAVLRAMNTSVNMYTYYARNIDGGAYPETKALVDSQLPENPRGLRNGLAQQLLHREMVDMQYQNLKF